MPTLLPFSRSETLSHCRRVCALARETAHILNLGEAADVALGIAASLHHLHGAASVAAILDGFPGISNEGLALAERILVRVSGNTSSGNDLVEISADVLNVCNEFDEAVEFAALEGVTFAEAIAEFHHETRARVIPDPRSALRDATSVPVFKLPTTDLPVMPEAGVRLMRTSDETSPATLASIVGTDQILTARLLEIANSARFALLQPIPRLTDAIARIGVPQARRVLFAACFGRVFASASLRSLWDKSQRIASIVATVAGAARLNPDEAYVTGLLHDIGRLVFEFSPARSRIHVSEWLSSGFPLPYAEALTYSMDHAGAGAELLRSWGLPNTVIAAVENHHRPEHSASPMASLLFLAEQWHAEKFGPEGGQDLLQGMRTTYASRLTGISVRDLTCADDRSELHVIAC